MRHSAANIDEKMAKGAGIRTHDLLISDIRKPELWYRPSLTNRTGIKISQNKIRTTELKQLFAVKNNLF